MIIALSPPGVNTFFRFFQTFFIYTMRFFHFLRFSRFFMRFALTCALDFFSRIAYNSNVWRRIEVVITGLTRNQFALTGTWVRIPSSPPFKKAALDLQVQLFCALLGSLWVYDCFFSLSLASSTLSPSFFRYASTKRSSTLV